MKKVLFIDRDGTLALEPEGYQLDSFEKLDFYPGAFTYLGKIAKELNFELVMITNQDGLGTASFPEETFWPVQHFLLRAFQSGVVNIPSYQLKPGDVVAVRERSQTMEVIANNVSATNTKFSWIQWDGSSLSGTFVSYPERSDIPENIKEQLIVELYSK